MKVITDDNIIEGAGTATKELSSEAKMEHHKPQTMSQLLRQQKEKIDPMPQILQVFVFAQKNTMIVQEELWVPAFGNMSLQVRSSEKSVLLVGLRELCVFGDGQSQGSKRSPAKLRIRSNVMWTHSKTKQCENHYRLVWTDVLPQMAMVEFRRRNPQFLVSLQSGLDPFILLDAYHIIWGICGEAAINRSQQAVILWETKRVPHGLRYLPGKAFYPASWFTYI